VAFIILLRTQANGRDKVLQHEATRVSIKIRSRINNNLSVLSY